jgi:hypothetical protein
MDMGMVKDNHWNMVMEMNVDMNTDTDTDIL